MSNDSDDTLYTYNRLYNFVNNKYNPYKTKAEENQNQFYIMGTGKHRNQTNSNVGRIQ
jgi:hypothetical protein